MTPTPTFTPTPTVTPTPSATPEYYVLMWTPAGEGARIVLEMNMGDYWIILLLTAIVLSLWAIRFMDRLGKREE